MTDDLVRFVALPFLRGYVTNGVLCTEDRPQPGWGPHTCPQLQRDLIQGHCIVVLYVQSYYQSRTDMPLRSKVARDSQSVGKSSAQNNPLSSFRISPIKEPETPPTPPAISAHEEETSRTISPAVSISSIETSDRKAEANPLLSKVEWIRPSFGDPEALGKGMFPFERNIVDDSQLVIRDITIQGTVVLADLKAGVTFNHVIDLRVDETEITKLKQFVHSCSKLLSEGSGEVKWNDTPIRPPGNIVHCVNKKDIQLPFTEVWDARDAANPFAVEPEDRIDLSWSDIKRDEQVLVEVIPEIYLMANKYGVTLHLVTIGLLQIAEPELQTGTTRLLLQSPKKKRKVE
jgi:hypothetical protein